MKEMMTEYRLWTEKSEGWVRDELRGIEGKQAEIEDRFYTHLAFGTGGLRGVIGAGTNRMNVYSVRRASRGFANFLNAQKNGNTVVIAYDSRNYSDVFAAQAAAVFATQGIKTYLFKTLMPTPVCSYAVRALHADAGVMVTASHNPKIYNGYKAYGADGCQITNEVADGVIAEINAIEDYFSVACKPFDELLQSGMIEYVPECVYEGFLQAVAALSVSDGKEKQIKIVYSPLNGTGNVPVREILKRRGFNNVSVVKEQEMPDGNFTTCPFPNPEIKEALALALAQGAKENADLILATDPDCDRVGIAVKEREGGEYVLMSGNAVGILLTQYLLAAKKEQNKLPARPVIVRTIVSTDLVDDIGADYNAEVFAVLTGFKYIGEIITGLAEKGEEDRYILGFEESYGYMSGGHVRDKDAVNGSMLIAEMCDYYARRGKTLYEVLIDIYEKYGYFGSYQKSVAFAGSAGLKEMNDKMQALQASPPSEFAGCKVRVYKDYNQGIDGLPPSNVLLFKLDCATVIARPSGTEPKLKIYLLARGKNFAELDEVAAKIIPAMEKHFQ